MEVLHHMFCNIHIYTGTYWNCLCARENTLLSTLLIIPLMYYFFNYFRKSKHQTIIIKIMLVGCGGFSLGIFIWFFIGYTFIMAPWAPLNNLTGVLRQRIFLLLLIFSWGLAAYIMYRIGKKRDWRPPSHLIN